MALIGELPRFHNDTDDWLVFTERLEQIFEINDVAPEKKKAILITCIGDDVYKTLRDVCHPALPKEKTYDELCSLLNKQFVARTSVFRERYNFFNAHQEHNEPVATWFARIKCLSIDCKLGKQFDAVLLNRFISGLRMPDVVDRLCEEDEDKLTMQMALEIAMVKESSIRPVVDAEKRPSKRHWGGDEDKNHRNQHKDHNEHNFHQHQHGRNTKRQNYERAQHQNFNRHHQQNYRD